MAADDSFQRPPERPTPGSGRLAQAARAFERSVQSGQTDLSGPVAPSGVNVSGLPPELGADAPAAADRVSVGAAIAARLDQLESIVRELVHTSSRTAANPKRDESTSRRLAGLESAVAAVLEQLESAQSEPAQPRADRRVQLRLGELEAGLTAVVRSAERAGSAVDEQRVAKIEAVVRQLVNATNSPAELAARVDQLEAYLRKRAGALSGQAADPALAARLDELEAFVRRRVAGTNDPATDPGLRERVDELEAFVRQLATSADNPLVDRALLSRLDDLEAFVRHVATETKSPVDSELVARVDQLEANARSQNERGSAPIAGMTALVEQLGFLEGAVASLGKRVGATEKAQALARPRPEPIASLVGTGEAGMDQVRIALRRLSE
ncbi:MAG: hypothetical protein ACR2LQ_13525 [Acidimicrobiales bacterium]